MDIKINEQDAISRLTDAVAGLKRINPECLNYDREFLELCCKTRYLLENELAELTGTAKEVNEFAENNPELMAGVTLRVLSLASDIERNFKMGDQAIAERDQQIAALREQGYSPAEANEQISIDTHEEYLGALFEEIKSFQTEQRRLRSFLSSKPDYNIDLLIGTEFEMKEKEA